jgi:hypothetical protein
MKQVRTKPTICGKVCPLPGFLARGKMSRTGPDGTVPKRSFFLDRNEIIDYFENRFQFHAKDGKGVTIMANQRITAMSPYGRQFPSGPGFGHRRLPSRGSFSLMADQAPLIREKSCN